MSRQIKTVLITGASRGIGRETARQFAASGYRVAIGYQNAAAKAQELVNELRTAGCDTLALCGDVADARQVACMFEAIETHLGSVDILVNNAGFAQQKMFCDISPMEWERMFAVTVTGAYHCIQRALPAMIAKKSGAIINVSSIWGLVGASCEVHYSAAKAALIGMSKALAKEMGPSGVTVNCVAPGVIATDMCAALKEETLQALRDETPLGRLGTPADVAQAIVFLAQSGFITGQVLSPNGGMVL